MATKRDAGSGGFLPLSMKVKTERAFHKVGAAIDKAGAINIYRAAWLVSTLAKASIKTSKAPSQPGQPPTTRRGVLRRAIRYAVYDNKKGAVIGPEASRVDVSARPHELGGSYKGQSFLPRPFMHPALKLAAPRFAGSFKGKLGG